MAPRANWKGYLRLSLVSCPIALYPASSYSEKVSFNRINRKTGNRLKQQNVDSETGEAVSRQDTARGYEVGKGQYLIVEDEELDAVQVESTRTIEIDQFVPRSEIDDRYIDSPYYIAPDGQVGQDAFAVIRDTIGKLNMVALGRVVLTRREHVIALEPRGRPSRQQRCHPRPILGAVDLGIANDGECTGHEQAAQIAIPLFADTAEPIPTAARVLFGNQPDPGREVATRSEGFRIGDARDKGSG